MQTQYKNINANTTGATGIRHIDGNKFLNIKVPIPPHQEQLEIVEEIKNSLEKFRTHILDSENEMLQNLKMLLGANPIAENIYNLSDFKKAILELAVTGILSADWRENKKDATWKESSLENLFDVETGGTPSRTNNLYWKNGNIPWVKSGEVNNSEIYSVNEYITPLAVKETNTKTFPPGTILIAMYGEGKTRGQAGILRINAATNQAIAALVNKTLDETTVKFVYYFVKSQYEKLRSQAEGSAQPNLNIGIIKAWRINLPTLDEQKIIVKKLESIFSKVDVVEKDYSIHSGFLRNNSAQSDSVW